MNLAFDRSLIGPAMYFGLQGEGQPIGRYDDMWAGWCTKVGVCTCRAVRARLGAHPRVCACVCAFGLRRSLNCGCSWEAQVC
jgi:hypothetical protein